MNHDTRFEKVALIALAALGMIVLWVIAYKALANEIGVNSATTIGVIATGILALERDVIAAIRGYSMSAQLGKVTDQLAASGPASPPAPQSAAEAAKDVAATATDRADQISETAQAEGEKA